MLGIRLLEYANRLWNGEFTFEQLIFEFGGSVFRLEFCLLVFDAPGGWLIFLHRVWRPARADRRVIFDLGLGYLP